MRYIFSFLLLFSLSSSYGQLTITNGSTPSVLVDSLVSGGVSFSSVTFSGVYGTSSKYQAGLFSASGAVATNLGFSSGIVLCTGNTNDIPLSISTYPGSSNFTSSGLTSTCANGEVRQGGSCPTYINDVDVLAGSQNYYNAAVLEFDFVPTTTAVEFQYVFGSEEYDQDDGSFSINYNCSSYNDKFGFIISGPGISGGQGYTNDGKNIARLANGSEVSINSVNNGVVGSYGGAPSAANCTAANSSWSSGVVTAEFNGPIYGIQFNGNTKVLTASQTGLTAGLTYHIKLIVTDVNDGAYDSGVFLKASSFAPSTTLPIKLISFTGECEGNHALLKWQTATELNNDYFVIEKSIDGFQYFPIGTVDGSGNSHELKSYSFQGLEQENDMVYYRLKQIDFNGETSFSNTVPLKRCKDDNYQIDYVFYNSLTNEIVVNYTVIKTEKIDINIFDLQGKVVSQNKLVINQNENQVRLSLDQKMDNAVYFVSVISSNRVDTKKIIITH
jgi:hypothetical protein